jgi:hypothetical protein
MPQEECSATEDTQHTENTDDAARSVVRLRPWTSFQLGMLISPDDRPNSAERPAGLIERVRESVRFNIGWLPL